MRGKPLLHNHQLVVVTIWECVINMNSEDKYYKVIIPEGFLYYSVLYKKMRYSETPVKVLESCINKLLTPSYMNENNIIIEKWDD